MIWLIKKMLLEIMEMMRSEDIANRIMAAFDEVLSWAKKDMQYAPELKHEVRTLELSRSVITEEIVQREKEYNKKYEYAKPHCNCKKIKRIY